jgi:hypothetical protein
MYKLALVTAAIFALAPSFTPSSAEARTRVTVSPVYVPAVYCSYKSAEWKTKGIVSCPLDWAPLGDLGTKWKTSSGGLMCWNTNTFGGKEYEGWWSPCKKK